MEERVDERQPNQPEMNGEQTAEGYSWTQTNDEIEIWVPISATLKPIVTFRQMTLKVSVNNVRVSLELYARVDTDGCICERWKPPITINTKKCSSLRVRNQNAVLLCSYKVFKRLKRRRHPTFLIIRKRNNV
mmetsp:Transcript_64041/g.75013  ORF Transcript_64041/g.75013 Transcript_64041/m.75013 type:complete len:132 (-) Transcript_64041:40-435(-)